MSQAAKIVTEEINHAALVRAALRRADGDIDKAKALLKQNRRIREYAQDLGLDLLVRQHFNQESRRAVKHIHDDPAHARAADDRRKRGAARHDATFYESFRIGMKVIGDCTYDEIQHSYCEMREHTASLAWRTEFLRLILEAMRPHGGTVREQVPLAQIEQFDQRATVHADKIKV